MGATGRRAGPRSGSRGTRGTGGGPRGLTGLLLILAGLSVTAGPAQGNVFWEAELNYEVHNLGGASIVLTSCQHASGGFSLLGLDREGDCVDYFFSTPTAWCFTDSIRGAAPVDGTWAFRLQVLPFEGGPPVVDYVHRAVQGRGMG